METLEQVHSLACGTKIFKDSFDSFLAEAYEKLDNIDFDNQSFTVDFKTSYKDFNKEIGELFANENIWGNGIEKPLIYIENIDCINKEIMGEGQHLKINTSKFDVVFFNNKEIIDKLKTNNSTLNIIGEINTTEWNGVRKLQIIPIDYELIEKKDDGWSIYDF